jgi:hypothetical protein
MKKTLIVALMMVAGVASAQTPAEKVLQQAINQVGEPCHKVTQTFLNGSYKDSVMYSVACSGGQTYLVKANLNDGTGNVLPCSVLDKINGGPNRRGGCFVKF